MTTQTATPLTGVAPPRQIGSTFLASVRPVWSKAAAYRALRATLVIPSLFALTYVVIGDLQMAIFAAFGAFATLVLANFGGSRREKLVAHLCLGLAGSVLLVIGTAVASSTAVAAVVTLPVAFCVLFAGIAGPNAASGGTAALLAYVLPAASAGTLAMAPSRLAGWWFATAAGTVAVLVLSPQPTRNPLGEAAAECAEAVAAELDASLGGQATDEVAEKSVAAKGALSRAFAATPYRPTGLASSDQALANLVEALEWCATLVTDMVKEGADLTTVSSLDRELLAAARDELGNIASVLRGAPIFPDLDHLAELQRASAHRIGAVAGGEPCTEQEIHISFHARIVVAATRSAALDVLIATGREDQAVITAERLRWTGRSSIGRAGHDGWPALLSAAQLVGGNASVRSMCFLNSARGALALAAAVTVADLTNVQHGFWVVLGTLSVLRTSAASTGSTALRAIVGTAIGFFIGAALLLAIGDNRVALWVALPIAVMGAAYSPGTAPFAVGQAAFTVTVVVLFNILVPVGWQLGVLRVEDVAIGAAVSAIVGLVFWPRGAAPVVAADLSDAFHQGGLYLVEATAWAVGARATPPDAGVRATNASLRLDDALRGLAAEQGTKRASRHQVWHLVGGVLRLRLTAQSLSALPERRTPIDSDRRELIEQAATLAGWYDGVAGELGRTPATVARELANAVLEEPTPVHPRDGYLLWVRHHLDHIKLHLNDLVEPVALVVDAMAIPWWR